MMMPVQSLERDRSFDTGYEMVNIPMEKKKLIDKVTSTSK